MSDTGSQSLNALHIAFGVDEHYVHPMAVTMASIIANNPGLALVFHVFIADVSPSSRERLAQLASQSGQRIDIHGVDLQALVSGVSAQQQSHAYISKAAYTRLLIPEALAAITDRVLYLDADILCLGDISGLLNLDLEGATAAVVRDLNALGMRTRLSHKQLLLRDYFNSGVLLIDIPRWLEQKVSERALAKITDPLLNLKYFDQDALNIVLEGKVRVIDSQWNCQYPLTSRLRKGKTQMDVPADTRFVHFIGPLKPWRTWSPHQSRELFVQYQALSPWAGTDLDEGFTPRERHVYLRFMYRHLFKEQQWLKGLLWYVKFLRHKRSIA